MGSTTLVFLIVTFAFVSIGSMYFDADVQTGNLRNIYNYTENILVWNMTKHSKFNDSITNQTGYNFSEIQSVRLKNIFFEVTNTMGYVLYEYGKFCIELGYNHGYKYGWRKLFDWAKVLIVLWLFSNMFVSLVMLAVIIYLVFCWIKKLLKNIYLKILVKKNGDKK